MIGKKLAALLLAALLLASLAACGKSEDKQQDDSTGAGATRVVYDMPEGYVQVGSNSVGGGTYGAYGVLDDEEDPMYVIGVAVVPMRENFKDAFDAKDIGLLDEEYIDEVSVEQAFVDVGSHTTIQIMTYDESDGQLFDIAYYLQASSDWLVMVASDCSPSDLDTIHPDMLAVIESVRVEDFTFQSA